VATTTAHPTVASPADYLAFERAAEERHEYIDGRIVALSRGSFAHAVIAGNIAGELGAALPIPSLTDYVLVSQKQVLVEHFQRQDDGSWVLRALGPGERLALPSLGCDVAVDGFYLKAFEGGKG
jgi:Uma2 family endonuclease